MTPLRFDDYCLVYIMSGSQTIYFRIHHVRPFLAIFGPLGVQEYQTPLEPRATSALPYAAAGGHACWTHLASMSTGGKLFREGRFIYLSMLTSGWRRVVVLVARSVRCATRCPYPAATLRQPPETTTHDNRLCRSEHPNRQHSTRCSSASITPHQRKRTNI